MSRLSQPVEEQTPSPGRSQRRYVYNGDAEGQSPEYARRGNRPVKYRKRSLFNVVAVIIALSVLIVFYVWNKLMVNRLVVEVADLQSQYDKVLNTNDVILAEINKKSSLERIGRIASEKLGLVVPQEQPVWFDVEDRRPEPPGGREK